MVGAPPMRVLTALGSTAEAEESALPSPPHAALYGALLWTVLVEVVEGVLRLPMAEVVAGLYYMPTIRANVFVCCALPDALLIHVNALIFEQSLACECDADDHSKPTRVAPHKWAELLPYWLHRVVAALKEAGHPDPTARSGIYDAAVRQRLLERIDARSGGGSLTPHSPSADPQRLKPPPVPAAVLRPAGDALRVASDRAAREASNA